ncbi:MAG: LEPR-XLL domain-containing protein, partial [Phycisphaerae bacterium]
MVATSPKSKSLRRRRFQKMLARSLSAPLRSIAAQWSAVHPTGPTRRLGNADRSFGTSRDRGNTRLGPRLLFEPLEPRILMSVLVQPELDNQYRRLRYCRVRTGAFF